MDALIASAGPLPGPSRSRPSHSNANSNSRPNPKSKANSRRPHLKVPRSGDKDPIDPSTQSILSSTRLPAAYLRKNLASGSELERLRPAAHVGRVKDKKLRARLAREDVGHQEARRERREVDEWLNRPVAAGASGSMGIRGGMDSSTFTAGHGHERGQAGETGGATGGTGGIEVDEAEGERTWRVRQEEIVRSVGLGAGTKRFDLRMDPQLGSYQLDYTRNGRHLAIASSRGHVATFDWQAGKLHGEMQLRESVRCIRFLQSESFYAVAQKKHVYVYDKDGVEVHKLKQHLDPTHMEFLPYHYLLATVGNSGYLRYHDVSLGSIISTFPTHLGSPSSMSLNSHSGIVHLGHANGTMTLWSPNQTTPYIKLLAHRGPVSAIAIDPSERSAGRYCATSGLDGMVKLWDGRMWGKEIQRWRHHNAPTTLDFSGRGVLAVGSKSGASVYRDLAYSSTATHNPSAHSSTPTHTPGAFGPSGGPRPPPVYLTLPLPGLTCSSARFCPFDDSLALGHTRGVSSLLVPGAGEAGFDSAEADVYETRTRRREREVRGVLEKIRPELITLDEGWLGRVAEDDERPGGLPTYDQKEGAVFREMRRVDRLKVNGQYEGEDEDGAAVGTGMGEGGDKGEVVLTAGGDDRPQVARKEKERNRQKGKGGSTARYLRKKKKNVIDKNLLAMRAKVDKQKRQADEKRQIESGEVRRESGALARFGR